MAVQHTPAIITVGLVCVSFFPVTMVAAHTKHDET